MEHRLPLPTRSHNVRGRPWGMVQRTMVAPHVSWAAGIPSTSAPLSGSGLVI